ncbi:MAG: FAD/NAD(P)-binding protein, partial [Myxococcales bacterium]|nr:FAD/NAD(P)-binding protein [Myxococcales bacterium]
MKRIVILGAGTAGTMMAHKLLRRLPEREWEITVVDRDDAHVYQPGLLFLPFGLYEEKDMVRSRKSLLPKEVRLVRGTLD